MRLTSLEAEAELARGDPPSRGGRGPPKTSSMLVGGGARQERGRGYFVRFAGREEAKEEGG